MVPFHYLNHKNVVKLLLMYADKYVIHILRKIHRKTNIVYHSYRKIKIIAIISLLLCKMFYGPDNRIALNK